MKSIVVVTVIGVVVAVGLGFLATAQPRGASSRPAAGIVAAAPQAGAGAAARAAQAPAGQAPAALPAAGPAADIVRRPEDVPPPIARTAAAIVRVDLESKEVVGTVADGTFFTYWTFNGTVPGPFLRVRVGDTVELHLQNAADSRFPHSTDLHAVTGPGGGSAVTQTAPGRETILLFRTLNPGLYVYHCASAPVPMHVAMGMYGMIPVEPEGGLPPVDRELYIVQGELYTNAPAGTKGALTYDPAKATAEHPTTSCSTGSPSA